MAFVVHVGAEISGVKDNLELRFPQGRPSLDEFVQEIEIVYGAEQAAKAGGPPERFAIDQVRIYDEVLGRWVDMTQPEQLHTYAQVYAFQPDTNNRRDMRGLIPAPRVPQSQGYSGGGAQQPPPMQAAGMNALPGTDMGRQQFEQQRETDRHQAVAQYIQENHFGSPSRGAPPGPQSYGAGPQPGQYAPPPGGAPPGPQSYGAPQQQPAQYAASPDPYAASPGGPGQYGAAQQQYAPPPGGAPPGPHSYGAAQQQQPAHYAPPGASAPSQQWAPAPSYAPPPQAGGAPQYGGSPRGPSPVSVGFDHAQQVREREKEMSRHQAIAEQLQKQLQQASSQPPPAQGYAPPPAQAPPPHGAPYQGAPQPAYQSQPPPGIPSYQPAPQPARGYGPPAGYGAQPTSGMPGSDTQQQERERQREQQRHEEISKHLQQTLQPQMGAGAPPPSNAAYGQGYRGATAAPPAAPPAAGYGGPGAGYGGPGRQFAPAGQPPSAYPPAAPPGYAPAGHAAPGQYNPGAARGGDLRGGNDAQNEIQKEQERHRQIAQHMTQNFQASAGRGF